MKAKEYLQQLPVLDMKINLKLKELEALKVKLIGVGGVDYSNDRVQTSPQNAANFTEILKTTIQDLFLTGLMINWLLFVRCLKKENLFTANILILQ